MHPGPKTSYYRLTLLILFKIKGFLQFATLFDRDMGMCEKNGESRKYPPNCAKKTVGPGGRCNSASQPLLRLQNQLGSARIQRDSSLENSEILVVNSIQEIRTS